MRSAVLQFLLAGALVVAWIWMLGRPLLSMLVRRSRRDSVGHFRSQQAALGRTVGADPADLLSTFSPLRPLVEWRAQPVEQRRLQLLLGSALATFASVLLAIALRGVYVRLLLLMVVGFAAHLLVAALIGSRQLRAQDAELRRMAIDAATRRAVGRSVKVRSKAAEAERITPKTDDEEDLLVSAGLGGGVFDEGFFEPIPELDPQVDPGTESAPDHDDLALPDTTEAPAARDEGRQERTFSSPPEVRPRANRRPKGRPIYIEPEPDEGEGTIRAAND